MAEPIADTLRRRLTRARWTILLVVVVFGGLAALDRVAPRWMLLAGALAIATAAVATSEGVTLRQRLGARERRPGVEPLELIRAVAAKLPDPLVLMDASGGIILQNERADEVLGHRHSGQHISAALRAPQIFEALRRAGETGEAVAVDYSQPVPIERHFEAYVAPIHAPGGDAGAPALLMVLRDLTRQERIERMRADFVAHASHELRTPLAALIGFVETLQGAARDDRDARDRFLAIMQVEAGRMSRLIDDLLSLSRIELNAHVLPTEEVDVNLVVGHAANALAPLADENGVRIEVETRGEPLMVFGDNDELVQVFQNLIQNAIKYGRSGGRVVVTARPSAIDLRGEPAAGAVVEVRDFGPGIAAEHIPRLTERFYRADAADSRQKGGTGLGLAIVKHILNRHRGTLSIRSDLGAGSTFTVSLPLAAASREEAASRRAQAS